MDPILTIPQLDVSIKNHPILQRFQLSLYRGRCTALVGESGSGKTMAALSITQLLPTSAVVSRESQIFFDKQDLLSFSEKRMRQVRGKKIGFIFQDAMTAFNPVLTVGYQLSEVLRLHLQYSKKQAKLRVITLLEEVGIKDPLRCAKAYPHELSGGMRQRAMIAMAVAAEPDIIIADEPTTALDPELQSQILMLLDHLKKEKNCAVLFIGHDLSVIQKIADDIVVLKKGEVVESSAAADFFRAPKTPYSQLLLAAILPASSRKMASIQTETLLKVDNVKVYFPIRSSILRRTIDVVKAVDGVSFSVKKGETVALIGESGSGKTTIAKTILQLTRQTAGDIVFENNNLSHISSSDLRRLRAKMQIIFQDSASALNPRMTIAESLREGLVIQSLPMTASIIEDLLAQVELSAALKSRYPHELSGGQRQRVCIARALALSPALLVLDEPTSALDVSTQKQILDLLDRLQKEKQLSYLLITHSMPVVNYLAHRVIKMQQGKVYVSCFI